MLHNPIWFVVSFALLGWVTYLKWQILELKKDKEQLAAAVRFAAKRMKPEIETSSGGPIWGQTPRWMR
jgi:hypothetical protein